MFGPQKKTLIIVYKDEMLLNQLKKLIESPSKEEDPDDPGISGETVNIVAWTEKLWKQNSAPGNITGKILFLGDLKGTDKLIPVIDKRFCETGITFGWAGNQAVLFADPNVIKDHESYSSFLKKLLELPIPDVIKYGKKGKPEAVSSGEDNAPEKESSDDLPETVAPHDSDADCEGSAPEGKPGIFQKSGIIQRAGVVWTKGWDSLHQVRLIAAVKAEDLFRDKSMVKRQMLFYGVISLYKNGLREFLEL